MKYLLFLILTVPIAVYGQTLTVENGGSLTGELGSQIDAEIINNGTVEISEFVLTGNYDQSASGTYVSEIMSAVIATSVTINGDVSLEGTLVVENQSPGLPPMEDAYTLMEYTGALLGEFDTVDLPAEYSEYSVSYGQFEDGKVQLVRTSLLPVKLIEFNAIREEDYVRLRWKTASEINNEGFHVQHSIDGLQWSNFDWVDGFGNSQIERSYTTIHSNPVIGENYYRLHQIDFDGQSEYSTIESVNFDAVDAENTLVVYPNPTVGEVQISSSDISFVRTVSVFDLNGVLRLTVDYATGGTIDLSDLEDGMYYLQIEREGKQPIITTVVKVK